MKLLRLSHLAFGLSLVAWPFAAASGITFSSNTLISPGNTNFDGLDIVVTNCTVTIDGAHSFASLQLQKGGVLTHSFIAGGSITVSGTITNEVQVLNSTNPVPLNATNIVDGTVVVTDSSGLVTYTNGVDYILTGTGSVT